MPSKRAKLLPKQTSRQIGASNSANLSASTTSPLAKAVARTCLQGFQVKTARANFLG
jgi:hypothetical protein